MASGMACAMPLGTMPSAVRVLSRTNEIGFHGLWPMLRDAGPYDPRDGPLGALKGFGLVT